MVTQKYNFNVAPGVETFPATSGNAITEDYYWSLVGQINDGIAKKAVCRIETLPFGVFSYHLISQR